MEINDETLELKKTNLTADPLLTTGTGKKKKKKKKKNDETAELKNINGISASILAIGTEKKKKKKKKKSSSMKNNTNNNNNTNASEEEFVSEDKNTNASEEEELGREDNNANAFDEVLGNDKDNTNTPEEELGSDGSCYNDNNDDNDDDNNTCSKKKIKDDGDDSVREEEDINNSNSNTKGFTTKGYQICNLTNDISPKDMMHLNKKAEIFKTNPIFNQDINKGIQTEDVRNDKKRNISVPINKNLPVFKRMIGVINEYAGLINNKYTVQNGYVLRSLKGCAAQAVHTDGNGHKIDFFSCLFAIQEGTKINIDGRIVDIPTGEALFFHSAVKHHGCSYTTNNNRYFFYIAKTMADIPIDEVGDLEPIRCEYCKKHIFNKTDFDNSHDGVCKMKKKISNHRRSCEALNSKQKLDERRIQANSINRKNREKRNNKT